MKNCLLTAALLVPTTLAAVEITLCVEKTSMDDKGQKVVDALNADVDLNKQFTFKFLGKTSPTDVMAAFADGTCNMVEFDAGKAYALSVADKTSFPIAQEGSGSYETQAIAKKSKLDADGVKTFCDLVGKKYRACHTGAW